MKKSMGRSLLSGRNTDGHEPPEEKAHMTYRELEGRSPSYITSPPSLGKGD